MTWRTDSNTAKKRSLEESQKSEGSEEQAPESSYSAGLNVDAFIKGFDSAPKGTVSAWESHAGKLKDLIGKLEKLSKNGSPDNLDNLKQQFQALIGTEQRKTLFDGPLDMEIDWSDVETALASKSVESWAWACTCMWCVSKNYIQLGKILTKLKDTKDCLKALCLFSNLTGPATYASQSHKSLDDEINKEQINEMMMGVKAASPTREGAMMRGERDEPPFVPQWLGPGEEAAKDLEALAVVWNKITEEAKIMEPLKNEDTDETKEKYKTAMKNTANHIKSWNEYTGQPVVFPSVVAGEKDAVQPILYALLCALSGIGNDGRDDVRRERRHEPGRTGSRQFMDFEPCFVDGFFPSMLPHELSVAVEVKNLTGNSKSAKAMHDEVIKQLTGYMAKRILVAFEVGNVGVNATAVGIVITPAYVQVLRLELTGMGTINVDVKLVKTELASLVSLAAFQRLVPVEDTTTRSYLGPKLFPGEFDESGKSKTHREDSIDTPGGDSGDQQGEDADNESVVPQALTLLWKLMHATKESMAASLFHADHVKAKGTFVPWTVDTGFAPESVAQPEGLIVPQPEDLIGTGAHGTVYKCSNDSKACIKASRVGETLHIQRELKALKALNVNKCENIPWLLWVGQLKYDIRNVTAVVPAFVISPLGKSLRKLRGEARHAQKMNKHIQAALAFAHDRKVFHLDVRLDNIIYDENAEVFVLIDWSSAACSNEKVVGFRGSLAFAHCVIHGKKNEEKWDPEMDHDLASLAFTVAAFMHTRAVPWDGFSRPLGKEMPAKGLFENRRTLAMSLLEEAGIKKSDLVRKIMEKA